jgi:hypothetical protein
VTDFTACAALNKQTKQFTMALIAQPHTDLHDKTTYSGFSTFAFFKARVPNTLSVIALYSVVSNLVAFVAHRVWSLWAIVFEMPRLTAKPAVFCESVQKI